MIWKPHDYQLRAVKFMVKQAAGGLLLDPGLGKTVCTLSAFKILKAKRLVTKMLVIAPLRPALSTWPAEVRKWAEFSHLTLRVLHGTEKGDDLFDPDVDIHVVNPEGLPWLTRAVSKVSGWPWEVLVVDECFPAGTQVTTDVGDRPIESIQAGDTVLTSAGLRRVLETGTRRVDRLVRLVLSSGTSLECTREHPVFTDLGWVPAHLAVGRVLYDQASLSELRGQVSGALRNDPAGGSAEVLLSILRSEADVEGHAGGAAGGCVKEDVREFDWPPELELGQAVAGGSPGQVVEAGQVGGQDDQDTRWERDGDGPVREVGGRGLAARVAVELRGAVGAEALRLSNLLQTGLRAPREEDRVGGGRPKPQEPQPAGAGLAQGAAPGAVRVESVQDLQREGTVVYNLRVAGRPHFFAGGVLVHNSTRFKNTRSQRFKLLKPMLPKFRRRYILTGSPAPNGLLDLFGQVFILDGGSSLGQHIGQYRLAYFKQSGYMGYDWVPQPGAAERIYERIQPLVLRMAGEDYLELPPLVDRTIEVELPTKAMGTYRQMETLMIAALEDGAPVLAANAAAATNKCRQIANGGIYHDGGVEWTHLHEAKADAVEELVEELSGKPALVAYEYQHDLERLQKKFPGAPYIGGGVPTKRFREIEAAWNRGDIPVLLAQPVSVAHGLNLQGTGAVVIWHSIPWDLEVYEQFIRRVWRQGQKERVFNYHIVAKGTVDEAVMKSLGGKNRTQRALLSALKEYVHANG